MARFAGTGWVEGTGEGTPLGVMVDFPSFGAVKVRHVSGVLFNANRRTVRFEHLGDGRFRITGPNQTPFVFTPSDGVAFEECVRKSSLTRSERAEAVAAGTSEPDPLGEQIRVLVGIHKLLRGGLLWLFLNVLGGLLLGVALVLDDEEVGASLIVVVAVIGLVSVLVLLDAFIGSSISRKR